MTLPASGNSIALSQVNTELNLSAIATIGMNDSIVRTLFGVASGTISMSQGFGKSSITAQGIWMGGNSVGGSSVTTIDRLLYSTETNAAVSATLLVARNTMMALTSKLKAFFLAGTQFDFTIITEIDGYDFQTSTANNPAAVTNTTSYANVGGINSNTAGYRFASVTTLAVDKFVFSTETFNAAITSVVLAKGYAAMFSATSVNKGYAYGGALPGVKGQTGSTSNIQGLDFASDTVFTVAATAVTSGMSYFAYNGGNTGYAATNLVPGIAIEGFTYSTETAANTGWVLSASGIPSSYAQYSHYGVAKGYTGGGLVAGERSNIITYMQFSNGTNGHLSATLSSPRLGHGATQSAYV